MIERAKKIQRMMVRAGFLGAAEEFLERACQYSTREFERIERSWLSYSSKNG